jgi:ABC-type transport system substrate-binding protein
MGFTSDLASWRDMTYERLVKSARRTQDQSERVRLYQQMDKILINEAIILPLIYDMKHLLVKPWVRNFPISPVGKWFLKEVIIKLH